MEDRKFGEAYYHLALVDLQLQETPNAVPQLRRAVELLKPARRTPTTPLSSCRRSC